MKCLISSPWIAFKSPHPSLHEGSGLDPQHLQIPKTIVTFIYLILKKEGAENIKDYRPMGLVGSMYKITSKILASKLEVLLSMVSIGKGGFLKGNRLWIVYSVQMRILILNRHQDPKISLENIYGRSMIIILGLPRLYPKEDKL